ncbi:MULTISPECIES: hypothetical protein [Lacticaseibacillus]|uniref:Uncharacterized protein n=2 Tax=Lacticaseibacillus TaxID=2759736 RepID=A0ABZ0BX97_LACCA|nr:MULTISPECIES: hypothetical protein [Lacticaseibacillus]KAB1970171.1 hypothetical protein F9B82_07430 [Lacticaseibacillus casei]WLV80706.1 hypothetical protein LACSTY_002796 [Lacticaseibacillus sp. NCIMB 15473]WNX24666.1 hypothetical protein RWA15_13705 [Lacticaseibacillus casei]WNX27438.1 hypothetical protein RWA16_13705 [Lacticaseibacillus casei]
MYPAVKENAPNLIQAFLAGMEDIIGLNPSEWTSADIQQYVDSFADEKPDEVEAMILLSDSLDLIETFLVWLSARHVVHIKQMAITQIMMTPRMDLSDRIDATFTSGETDDLGDGEDMSDAFTDEDPWDQDNLYQPDEFYQSEPHVDKIGDQQWQLATATSVHDQLLKYIRLAWAAEDSQDLRDAYPQSVVIDAVVQMGDALYAQHLETLQTWEPEHFLDYITNTIHTQSLEKSQALIASWIHLLLYLIFNDKIEREHGDELLAMFARGAQLLPKPKPKGRAVSLSDYKRGKRKSKKRRKKR